MASAASNYNKTLVQIQKLANTSAKTIQNMINKSNKEQATFNSAEAQKSRDWQEKMSKTAHQMEVKDLKLAGLNPVLSTGGSGAQSYTTSSASTQNDSGSSATAAILSDQLGAMSNMESARMNADASLKASERQAKATRYAAQQSAQAQMYAAKYAADQSYALGKYKADLSYKSQQEERANQRYIMRNQNAATFIAFLDKWMRNSGFSGTAYKAVKTVLGNGKDGIKKILYDGDKSDIGKYSTKGMTLKNYRLPGKNTNAYQRMNISLESLGIRVNHENRDLLFKAAVFNDRKSTKTLLSRVDRSRTFLLRPGWR